MGNWLVKLLHLRGLQRKYVLYRVNKCLAGTEIKNFEKKRKLLNQLKEFDIGEGTKIVGPVEADGRLTIGKNCWVGKDLRINGNGSVVIGDSCDIGPEVTFQTGGHRIGNAIRRAGQGTCYHQRVGNGVWIGGKATILNGVSIGDGSVIAGCACVTNDIPCNILVGGVPAKKIRDL